MKNQMLKIFSATGIVMGMFLAGAIGTAQAQGTDSLQSQYEAELQRCESSAVIDKQACQREAGAALSEAKKGNLTEPEQDTSANRCQYLHGDQKTDCERLMQNPDARIEGSVESGGILRSMEYEYNPEETNGANAANGNDSVTKSYNVQ